jgi:hypothetical protein
MKLSVCANATKTGDSEPAALDGGEPPSTTAASATRVLAMRRQRASDAPRARRTTPLTLDPDRSPVAITLEHGLDLALQRAPRLIRSALGGPTAAVVAEYAEQLRAGAATPELGGEDSTG